MSTSQDSTNNPSTSGFARLTQRPNGMATPVAHAAVAGTAPPKKRRRSLESKFNIAEMVKMLYRGRWIILGTFILFFVFSVYKTYHEPFIYASSTRLLVERSPVENLEVGAVFKKEDHSIENQIQFFRSTIVGEHVANVIHKFVTGDRHEIDSLFAEYYGNTGAVPVDPSQLRLIKIEDNPKRAQFPGIADPRTIRDRVMKAISVMPEGTNDYLAVTAEGYTPLDAALIVNTYVVVFAKDNLARLRFNNASLKQFLGTQVKRSYDTLHTIESQLQVHLKDGYGMNVENRASELVKQYEETKLRHANLQIGNAERRKVIEDLSRNLDSVDKKYMDNLLLEPYVAMLQQEISTSEFEIEQIKTGNTIMNPKTKKYLQDDIRAKEERLSTLKEKLKVKSDELLRSQLVIVTDARGGGQEAASVSPTKSVMRLREAILNNKLRLGQDELVLQELEQLMLRVQEELATLPEVMTRTGKLMREKESAERLYGQMQDKYMDAWFSEQSVFGNIKVEDPAALNAAPIRPNRQANIFTGSLIGLALGIGLVVALSMLDSTVRSPDEIESHGLSVLATIPVINQMQNSAPTAVPVDGSQPKFTPHRVSHLDPRSSVAEAYRSLRTALQFASLDRPLRTIAVSSSAPQEGKSTTSSNLGIVMAQMGKRTLLVDTDLRRPVLHSVFGVKREPGLTNLLFDRATLNEAIQKTDVPNLFVLPCGIIPPNPAELLGSEKMLELKNLLESEFDFVIFDTPPVVAVTDALLLGMHTDAMILIARSDVSKIDGVMRAVDAVERSNVRLLGVVLNNFNVANAYGAYYRYYQYYHYYSSDAPIKRSWFTRFKRAAQNSPAKPLAKTITKAIHKRTSQSRSEKQV